MNLVQEDLVGTWEVALPGGIHVIQFEHGTTTGKRVIHVDGIEVGVVEGKTTRSVHAKTGQIE